MSESPVVDRGGTRGAFDKIKQPPPDCSVILTSPAGARLYGPTERVSRWSVWSGKYDYYVVVSGRRITASRPETMASRDPRFDFDLTIDMEVSVRDAVEFVRQYGMDGSVADPFYVTLRSNLRERVRGRVPAEINELNAELQRLSKEFYVTGASHGPVTIHAMDIHARISQRAMDLFEAMSIHDIAAEYGDEFILALTTQTKDEARRRAYLEYYEGRRKQALVDAQIRRDERDEFVAFVERTFGDDPKMRNKLLTDQEFLEATKSAFQRRQSFLIANRSVSESLVPPETKPRQLISGPKSAAPSNAEATDSSGNGA